MANTLKDLIADLTVGLPVAHPMKQRALSVLALMSAGADNASDALDMMEQNYPVLKGSYNFGIVREYVERFANDLPAEYVDPTWIEWNGGENPVPGKNVRVKLRSDPATAGKTVSSHWVYWAHAKKGDCGKYEVIAYQVQP